MYLFQNIKIKAMFARGFLKFLGDEIRRGTFRRNLRGLLKTQEITADMSWAELLEEKKHMYPDRVILFNEDREFTYRQMDENANKVANLFMSLGGYRGKGVAIIMNNCSEYMDVFIGSQKIGMYSIPMNTSLRGKSLQYILDHSDAEFLVIDD